MSRGGDPGRPPQALSPARAQPGPQEAPYLGIGKIFDIMKTSINLSDLPIFKVFQLSRHSGKLSYLCANLNSKKIPRYLKQVYLERAKTI